VNELFILIDVLLKDNAFRTIAKKDESVRESPYEFLKQVAEAAASCFFDHQGEPNYSNLEVFRKKYPGITVTIVGDKELPSYMDTPKGRVFFKA
jgi:hypothetical protein